MSSNGGVSSFGVKFSAFLLLLLAALVAHAESPNEAASAIRQLIQSENYSELFRNRYSEWHKVEAEKADPQEAINRLSARWKKQRDTYLAVYTQLTSAQFTPGKTTTPQGSETGETATTKVKLGDRTVDFTLYKMKNGLWGFHM